MANYVLLAGGIKKGSNGRFLNDSTYTSFAFDAVTEVQFRYTATTTQHVVDSKSSVSDHVVQNNDTFTINVVVSDSPVESYNNNTITYGSPANKKKRTAEAVQKLKAIKEAGVFVNLATDFDVISNCIIKSIGSNITGDTANAYVISIELEKIRIATAVSVTLVADATIKDSVTGKKVEGVADAKKPTDDEVNDFLFDDVVLNWLKDMFNLFSDEDSTTTSTTTPTTTP